MINKLLIQKLFIAFLVGFGGVMIPAVLNLLDDIHKGVPASFDGAWWLSVACGGFAAGLRALLAWSPINLTPSDAQHSVVKLAK